MRPRMIVRATLLVVLVSTSLFAGSDVGRATGAQTATCIEDHEWTFSPPLGDPSGSGTLSFQWTDHCIRSNFNVSPLDAHVFETFGGPRFATATYVGNCDLAFVFIGTSTAVLARSSVQASTWTIGSLGRGVGAFVVTPTGGATQCPISTARATGVTTTVVATP